MSQWYRSLLWWLYNNWFMVTVIKHRISNFSRIILVSSKVLPGEQRHTQQTKPKTQSEPVIPTCCSDCNENKKILDRHKHLTLSVTWCSFKKYISRILLVLFWPVVTQFSLVKHQQKARKTRSRPPTSCFRCESGLLTLMQAGDFTWWLERPNIYIYFK